MNRARFHRSRFNRLGGLVRNSLSNLGLENKVLQHQAAARWREVVSSQIAAVAVVENVRDGVLFVCCKSSTWSTELTFLKGDIIKRLNKAVGKSVIKDIRFSARGFRKVAAAAEKEYKNSEEKELEAVEISEADMEFAQKAAAAVPSEELAEKIKKAILTGRRLAELKRREGWKKCPKCSSMHNGKDDLCENCR